MDKIIRASNLQKALEDYDALKGQPVLYVNELPVSPNIRTRVYCKQTTSSIDESLVITIEELVERYAEETTEGHYVIPVTHAVTFSGETVRSIVIDNGSVTVYEDDAFTTEISASFNLEEKYLFEITNYVTEMEYYMGNGANQELSPVVSFAVIADLQSKIDGNYNTLDNKIDNEISNLAVDFTTDNLVANVATINNATVNNAVIDNAQVNNFDVSTIIINGSTGNDGELVGKVNGKLEWFSSDLDTNDFKVNYLTVNNSATIDNIAVNNITENYTKEVKYVGTDGVTPATGIALRRLQSYSGFGESGVYSASNNFQFLPSMLMFESEYKNTFESNVFDEYNAFYGTAYKNVSPVFAFIATKPFGNVYFAGHKVMEMNLPVTVDNVTVNVGSPNNLFDDSITTATLEFTGDPVTNDFGAISDLNVGVTSVFSSDYYDRNSTGLPYGINVNKSSGTIVTNVNNTQFTPSSFVELFRGKQSMTDCFLSNPSLIVNAPSGYNVWNNINNMYGAFSGCINFNHSINIPDGITNAYNIFRNAKNLNQPVTFGNDVTDLNYAFEDCYSFNQPIIIPDGVTNMSAMFYGCNNFNQPIIIPNNVTRIDYLLWGNWVWSSITGSFNSSVTIGNNVTSCRRFLAYQKLYNQPLVLPDSVIFANAVLEGCSNFNSTVTFGNNVTDVSDFFWNCSNFNQPVTIPDSATTIKQMFSECAMFNSPVNIGNNVTSMSYTFEKCPNFNQPITIPDTVTSMERTFSDCYSFNKPVTIGNNVTTMSYTFHNCSNFNQPLSIPDTVTVMSGTFRNCYNFNQPVNVPDSVTNMDETFYNCTSLNSPVTIGNNVANMERTFYNCQNFNQPVNVGNNVTNMAYTFYNCFNFNSPVNIGNNVEDMYYTFYNCCNFDQPVTIPNSVTNMAFTFYNCRNSFNQPVTIPNGVTNTYGTFWLCKFFNQPVIVPNGVTNMGNMFSGCTNLNQPVTIPSSVTNLDNTFRGCSFIIYGNVQIHISHEIALGDTSNYIYNCLANGKAINASSGGSLPSRILNDL